MLFARGANAVEVQHRLGHHSAAFTLSRYVHLLRPDDLGEPIDLDAELANIKPEAQPEPIEPASQPQATVTPR